MIDANCFTNLDEFKREEWPKKFVTVPSVGDFVESRSGYRLKVISITHTTYRNSSTPMILVELHR